MWLGNETKRKPIHFGGFDHDPELDRNGITQPVFGPQSFGQPPRPGRTSPRLENLEGRLSLSSVGVGKVVAQWDLNPQPLPPGFMMPMIQGNHIGTNALIKHAPVADGIQGQHIGYQ